MGTSTTEQVNLGFIRVKWTACATILGLLYYVPYYFKNLINAEIARLPVGKDDLIANMQYFLLAEAKPLYAFNGTLYNLFSFELLTILGSMAFVFATVKFINLILPSLNATFKLLVFLLLFVNPFIYFERGWPYQFFMQSLISILYYVSLYFILKYRLNSFSRVKFFLGYLLPIFVLLIGLNYFMPSFFHFIVLCMVIVLKKHVENPFRRIIEVIAYARDFLIIVFITAFIYVAEVISLWNILDYGLADLFRNNLYRGAGLDLTGRLLNLPNRYNMLFNVVGLGFAVILLLGKRNSVNLFLFLMVLVVYIFSYYFYIFFDIQSTKILQFPNYYFTFFIVGLLLLKHQSSLKPKLFKIFTGLTILFLVYFYFSSYFYYYIHNKQQQQMEQLAHKINDYVVKTYNTNPTPPIRLISIFNVLKINKSLPPPQITFFNVIHVFYARAFQGKWIGFPNITSYLIRTKHLIKKDMAYIENAYVRKKGLALINEGKLFPHPESVFLYNGVYFVAN